MRDHALINDVLSSRTGRYIERCIEDEKRYQSQHENGNRVPCKTDHADRLVDDGTLPDSSPHPQRNTDKSSNKKRSRCQFQCRGKITGDILCHRITGQNRVAEIAVQDLPDIMHELDYKWLIEPHLRADALDNSLWRIVAHRSNNRINRHDAADHEGNDHKPEQRD